MKTLVYMVEDYAVNHLIIWNPENEPEAIRLDVHPEATLKGEQLDALAEALTRARDAVEQPSLKARRQGLLKAGFRTGR